MRTFFKVPLRSFLFVLHALFFLTFMSPSSGITQWCGTSADPISLPSQQNQGAQGPYTLKLYIYVLQNSVGEGPTLNDANVRIEEIQQDFEATGITFAIQCIEVIKNSVYYFDPRLLVNTATQYSHPDGINVYLSEISVDGKDGLAVIGGNKCFAHIFKKHVPTHEIGHCLSLLHTHRGSPYSSDGVGIGGNPFTLPEVTGDMCADTPPDAGIYPTFSQDCEAWPPDGVNNVIQFLTDAGTYWGVPNGYINSPGSNVLRNFMSFANVNCVDRFTLNQATKMSEHIASSKTNMLVNDMIIADYRILELNDRYVNHDIIVQSGGTLDIRGITMHMAPGKKIIINVGGRLVTSGIAGTRAKLTNWPEGGCSSSSSNIRWGGIVLLGNHPSQFSRATFNNTDIENAEVGVSYNVVSEVSSTTQLPRLGCGNTAFTNNQIALFLRCSSPNYVVGANITHSFVNCQFERTSTYPGVDFVGFVFLQNIQAVSFFGCTFDNKNYAAYDNNGFSYGIRAFNSKVRIAKFGSKASTFENLSNPVAYEQSQALPTTLTMQGAELTNFRIGLSCIAASNPMVSQNVFNDNVPYFAGEHYGMQFYKGSITEIADNTLLTIPTMSSRGLYIQDLGVQNTFIRRNSFTYMRRGIDVDGVNGDDSDIFLGLKIVCNEFNLGNAGGLGYNDIVLRPNSRIGFYQGSIFASAGNIFSKLSGFDFQNQNAASGSGQFTPTYFYRSTVMLENPLPFLNLFKINVSNLPQCYNFDSPGTPDAIEPDYQAYNQEFNTLNQDLINKIDNGQTSSLLGSVQLVSSANKDVVKAHLIQLSPYLSETILLEVLNNSAFSATDISEILIANPDVLKQTSFYSQLLIKSDIFNISQWTAVEQARQNGCSLRTDEGSKVSDARGLRDITVGRAIQGILNQDSLDYTAYRLWLSRLGTLEAGLQIAESWLLQQNTAAWQQQLNTMRASESNLEKIAEINRYEAYRELLLDAAAAGRHEGILTEKEQSDVYAIATASDTYVSQMAKNLLAWYYDYSFEPSAARKAEQAETNTGKDITPTNAIAALQVLKVYPNPAAQYLMLEKTSAQVEVPMEVQLFNFSGSLIQTIQLNTPQLRIALPAERYPAGAYHYRVLSAGKTLQSGSISVQ